MKSPSAATELSTIYVRFRLIKFILQMILGGFFVIFIYRITGSELLTILGLIPYYTGILIGYFPVTLLVNRLGYIATYRFAFLTVALFFIICVLGFDLIPNYILLFSGSYGVTIGMFFGISNLFQLNKLDGNHQGAYISMFGWKNVFGVIVPTLTGFLITVASYRETFIFALLISLLGIFIPTQLSKTADKADALSWKEFRLMFKLRGIWTYTLVLLMTSYVGVIRDIAMMLVGFFILGRSELNVGLLAGAVSLVSGVSAILFHTDRRHRFFSYLSALGYTVLNTIYAIAWIPLGVAARELFSPLLSIHYDARLFGYEASQSQVLLGHHRLADSTEFLIYREIVMWISRSLAILLFAYILSNWSISYEELSRTLILVLAWWPIASLVINEWLQKKLEILKVG